MVYIEKDRVPLNCGTEEKVRLNHAVPGKILQLNTTRDGKDETLNIFLKISGIKAQVKDGNMKF